MSDNFRQVDSEYLEALFKDKITPHSDNILGIARDLSAMHGGEHKGWNLVRIQLIKPLEKSSADGVGADNIMAFYRLYSVAKKLGIDVSLLDRIRNDIEDGFAKYINKQRIKHGEIFDVNMRSDEPHKFFNLTLKTINAILKDNSISFLDEVMSKARAFVKQEPLPLSEVAKYEEPLFTLVTEARGLIDSVIKKYGFKPIASIHGFISSQEQAGGNDVMDVLELYKNNREQLEAEQSPLCQVVRGIKDIIKSYIVDFSITREELTKAMFNNGAYARTKTLDERKAGVVYPAYCNKFAVMCGGGIFNHKLFPELEEYFKGLETVASWKGLGWTK